MTDTPPPSSSNELVRTQAFPSHGPLELDLSVTLGRVDIHLSDTTDETLVELRHEPAAQPSFAEGLSSVLNWVSNQFGDQLGAELRGTPAQAVQQARVEQTGDRLLVHAAKDVPLRQVPLAVTVHAPAGSRVTARAGAASVDVRGPAARVDLSTGSGAITVERADGAATARTGTGTVTLGTALAGVDVKTGSGCVEVASLAGPASVITGTGDVRLGSVTAELLVRTGSGNVTVADAGTGSLELLTGSGDLRIGVRPGIHAEVELSSGAGKVTSDLALAERPPDESVPLRLRGRTGTGNGTVAGAGQ